MKVYDFLNHFSNMKIDLHFINHKALFNRSLNLKICIGKNLDVKKAVEILKNENAWYKNKTKKENVYFSYSKENKEFDIAFIDDISNIDVFKKKNHLLLVQTSKNKYQAFFKLSKKVDNSKLYKIQKALCYVYKGDIGALSPYQLKRLPSFYNTKYEPNFLVKVIFKGNNFLDVDKVLEFYKNTFEKANNINVYKSKNFKNSMKHLKTWNDFQDSDLSVADMRYACYLVRIGLSDDEIKERLLNESPDIVNRKRNYKDYIERTIRKAKSFVKI